MTNIAELMREAAGELFVARKYELGNRLQSAAAELERAEQDQKAQDLLLYGVSYSRDGKRIDPRDVVIQYPPTSAVPEGWTLEEARLRSAVVAGIRSVTGCPDFIGNGGVSLVDAIIAEAKAMASAAGRVRQ